MNRRKPEKIIIPPDPMDYVSISVDPSNPQSIKDFFKEYEGLTTGELGVLCGRSNTTIRRWKRSVNHQMGKNPFKRNFMKFKRAELEHVSDPAVWDNKEWFYHQYWVMKRGVFLIARVLKKSQETVHSRLKRYGIEIRKRETVIGSKHPCCSEAWLFFNYATRDEYVEWCRETGTQPADNGGKALTLLECSKIAGVVQYTIFNWLTKFRLHIRDKYEWHITKNAQSLLGQKESGHPTTPAPAKSAG